MRTTLTSLVFASQVATAQISLVETRAAFEGIDESEPVNVSTPADPDIGVGDRFIIQVVNSHIRCWGRNDHTNVFNSDLRSFLDLSPTSDGTDPRVIFDEGRFLVSAYGIVENITGRQIVVAISPTEAEMGADPLADWTIIQLAGFFEVVPGAPTTCATGPGVIGGIFADQPALGSSLDWWIVSAFLAPNSNTNPADFLIWLIRKSDLTLAGPFFRSSFDDAGVLLDCLTDTNGLGFPRPAKRGASPLPILVAMHEVAMGPCDVPAGKVDSVDLYAIQNPLGPVVFHYETVRLGPCMPDEPPCAPTPGGVNVSTIEPPLSANDARIASAFWHEDDDADHLWITLNTEVQFGPDDGFPPGTVQGVIKWYRLDMHGWPTSGQSPQVGASGTIQSLSTVAPPFNVRHSFYPSGVVNDEGDFAIVFGTSSTTETAAIRAWARRADGATLPQFIIKQSPVGDTPDDLFKGSCARWGDYFDVELDPRDDTFWGTGMYMKAGGSAEQEKWGTYIVHFKVD
jgi:hypothetical protein